MSEDFVENWRGQLSESLVAVAKLAPQAPEVDFASGLLATGLLWPVRAAVQEFDGDAIDAIRSIAGAQSKHILRAVQEWDDDQLAAARALSTAASENPLLAEALAALVAHFDAANLLSARLGTLPPQVVNQIKAALVNIGGIINIASLTLNVTHNIEIPPPPRPELPPETNRFVGRTHELAYFAEMLATRHIAVISGMVGVGKTALAAALARQSTPPDLIFWHTFHAREGIEVVIWKLAAFLAWHGQEELWRMLQSARQTGDQPAPAETLFDYILPMIEGHAYCLCLDDLHLIGEDPLLIRLVDRLRSALGEGRLTLVLTARQVPSFVRTIQPDVLGGLRDEDALLLLKHGGLALPEPLFQQLYTHTGGNPQFLTLAITVLQHDADPASAIDRLVETHDIERYLLAEVDQRLTEPEQAVMGAVAVLMGYPASQDAIEALLDGENVRRTLHSLIDRHLLMVSEGAQGRKVKQHAMVQSFYYDLMSGAKRRTLHLRAAAHYEADDSDLLRAAIHYEKAQAYSKSVQLATENVRLLIGLYQARSLAELLTQLEAERLSEVEWIQVNVALGQVYAFLGERDKAKACYEGANARLEWIDDSHKVSTLRIQVDQGLGQLHYNEAPAEALIWLQRALTELERSGEQIDSSEPIDSGEQNNSKQINKETEAALYIDLAWAHRRLYNVVEAKDALQYSLSRLPRRPSQLRGEALTRLATLHVSQFDLVNAEQYAKVAVENSRHLRDVWHEQSILVLLGTIKHMACDWKGASEEYEAALKLATAIGDRAAQTALEVNLGVVQTNLGNLEPAHTHLTKGLELSQESHLRNYELKAQLAIARLCMRGEDWENAEKHLNATEELVAIIGTSDAQFHLPLILSARAELRLAMGKLDEAMTLAQESVKMAVEQEKEVDLAICQRVLAQVLMARGEHRHVQEAQDLLEQSLPLLAGRHDYEAAKIKALLGQCLLRSSENGDRGAIARGNTLIEEARLKFEMYGARFDLAETLPQQS